MIRGISRVYRSDPTRQARGSWRTVLGWLLVLTLLGCGRSQHPEIAQAAERIEQGDYEGAVALLTEVLAQDPSDPEAHYQLGRAYAELERYQDALGEYEIALSLDPHREDVQYAIGKAAWKLGRKRAAVQAFLAILQSSATDAQIREMLELTGEVYQVHRLTDAKATSASPVVSPDGRQVAFVRTVGRVNQIWIMNLDGTDPKRLTPEGMSDASPQFSPDGRHILFSSRPAEDTESPAAIYIMDRDGTHRRLLLRGQQEMLNPSFSADGEQVIFEALTPDGWEIFRFDGSHTERLTFNQATDVGPKISPDGTRIVFSSTRDGHPDNYEIYVMNVDGSQQTRLTNDPALDYMPNFSADGQEIVFVSDRDGNEEIYVMRSDGSRQTRLTYSDWKDTTPAFSPDGQKILFASLRDSDYLQIYLLDRSHLLGRVDLLARLRKIHKRGW